ncbi:MAG: FAD-dependent oxidoreductase [Cyanobacteriota bacterium]|nr:FAD-dependent oxidoreductase [Cyanobacteriota bacterium]
MADVDVVVVGAGLSGLICARTLRQQGRQVRILEARDRPGGRLHSRDTRLGVEVDLGGQWGGRDHHRLAALIQELGLRRFPSPCEGDGIFHWRGSRQAAPLADHFADSLLFFQPSALHLPSDAVSEALRLQAVLQQLVERVPATTPWTAPDARELDQTTIAAWLDRQGAGPLARHVVRWFTRVGGSGGFEPHESSLLHLAWTQVVAPQRASPEDWLVEGAMGQVGRRLAAEQADALQLSAPVEAITETGTGVRVRHSGGGEVSARAVVVAVPPPLRLGIQFSPPLPPTWTALLQRAPMGGMVKVLALYPEAFWRQEGLSGLGIGDLPLLQLTADSSPPGGRPGILASFIAADAAARWQQQPEALRRAGVLADLATYWGPRAASPTELILHNWNEEPWTRGAFTSFLTPGAWTTHGSIWRQAHGRVIWAGTEAAVRWPGYFEGALEAGLAAAAQAGTWLGG